VYSVYDVFTPTTPARVNYVARGEVNDILVDALRTPGKQVIVYGESGCGKSTLLQRKLTEIYESHIITRCNAKSTFESIVMDAFDQMDKYYVEGKVKESSKSGKGTLGAQFWAVKASVESQVSNREATSSARVLPPQLTPQRLGQFMGAQDVCWVLEDFHKVPTAEKVALAQTLKVFSDLSAEFPALRIVAIGATDTAREVVQYDREMANRVAEIRVPLMTEAELMRVLVNGSSLMNVAAVGVYDSIVKFSSGLASTCHHLALNACLAAGIEATPSVTERLTQGHLNKAITRYVDESSDTLKALFEGALRRQRVRKYDNARLIISALADGPLEGISTSQIISHIRKVHPDYPTGNATTYLRRLTGNGQGGVIKQAPDGRFRLAEPMFHSYAQILLGKRNTDPFSVQLWEAIDSILSDWASTWAGRRKQTVSSIINNIR